MNAGIGENSLILKHQPYGEHHPYIPLPHERFPRDPVTGEPVQLNIETGHNPSAGNVWCLWRVDENPLENRSQAFRRTTGETTDQWQVELPAFNGEDVVHYRIFASGGGQQVESDEFTFPVSTWEQVVSVIGVEKTPQGLQVMLGTTRKDLNVRLRVEPDSTETLSLQLSLPYEQTGPNTMHPQAQLSQFEWGDLSVDVQADPVRIEFSRNSDGMKLQTASPMQVLVSPEGVVQKYQIDFLSPSDEAFYGFGERFNALDQRGNHLDNYVYGQYTGQGKRSYIPIPFFISSRGYGLWLETDRQAEFDLAAKDDGRWSFVGNTEEEHANLSLKLFFHAHPHGIVQAFTDLTGKPKIPPSWVFGLWMSSNDWNSQAEVLRQLHETQSQNIPATVLVIEAWSDEINFYIWNDAQYRQKDSSQAFALNEYTFPPDGHWTDPKTMIEELHRAGLRLVLWQNPTIKHAEPSEHLDETLNKADQEFAIQQDYVVTKSDGTPHRAEAHMPWFAGSLVLDFSNPKAADWWFKKREYLVSELGVDGFKSDGGEHIWDPETRFANGMRGSRGINTYPVTYERAYRLFMEARRGLDYVLFSRAGYTGAQQNPCHWAGDENSTWEAFRASVNAMLNVGLCGVSFMGWDIAGFAGPIPTSELYLRATAFSAFCPIMQYHSDVNAHRKPSRDRTPWNMQEQTGDLRVIPVFRKFANLRMNLLPYLLEQARKSSLSGIPLMRALPLEYPADLRSRKYPHEYLFGEALLVAPVMQSGVTSWPVHLPQGQWRDLWTGRVFDGPAEIEVVVPLDRIPVFQKKGSLLALNLDSSGELCSPVGNGTEEFDHLTLRIFPDGRMETTLLQSGNTGPTNVVVETNEQDGSLLVQMPSLVKDVDLLLWGNEPASVMANGKILLQLKKPVSSAQDGSWDWNPEKQEIRIHIPASLLMTTIIIHKLA